MQKIRLMDIFGALPDPTCIIDVRGNILKANKSFIKLFSEAAGKSKSDNFGLEIAALNFVHDILHKDYHENFSVVVNTIFDEFQKGESQSRRLGLARTLILVPCKYCTFSDKYINNAC